MYLLSLAERCCPRFFRPVLDRVNNSPIGKRIAAGALWSILGTGLAKLLIFISMILVAKILGKTLFGEFGLVRSTAMTFVTFSSFGMGVTATKHIAELLQTDKERAGRIIGLSYLFTIVVSLIVSIAFYLMVPRLCTEFLEKPHLIDVMRLGAVLLFFSTITGTQVSVMAGFQDFRGLAAANIIGGLCLAPVYVFGAYFGGLWGVIGAAILAILLNLAINSGFIFLNTRKHRVRYDFSQAYRELPILWKSNIPIVLYAVIHALGLWSIQLMLASQTKGTEELGGYYVAVNFQIVMLFLTQQITPVFLPVLTELNAQNKTDRFWKVARKGSGVILLASLASAIPFLVFSRNFMQLVGAEFVEGATALQAACIASITGTLSFFVHQILFSKGRNWTQLVVTMVATSAFVGATALFLSFQWGAASLFLGQAVGSLVSMTMVLTWLAWLERK